MNPTLRYPFPDAPAFGTTLDIGAGVRWLRMPLPMSLGHINLYLIDGGEGWYIVDTGIAGEQTQAYWQEILDNCLEGRPVIGIIVTHMHPDHIGQAGWLTRKLRVPCYMTLGEYYTARTLVSMDVKSTDWDVEAFFRGAGFDDDYLSGLKKNRLGFGKMIEELPASYIRLREGDLMSWGGQDWRVVIGEGHSPEHACLYNAGRKVMIAGDQIIANITSNVSVMAMEPQANPLNLWLNSLEALKAIPDDTLILPAHGLPFYGVQLRLQQLIDHHEDHMEALEEACLSSRTALSLLPVLFKRKLDQSQIGLAIGECIAHLHLLMQRGRIARLTDADGVYQYTTTDPSVANRRGKKEHHLDEAPLQV
ncbi:MAG: MBL fold metallo-hydrolase [Pseudomonadales bacterium]